ncbi:MAG TPA: helix-hairpin-helix domain-containing protein [Cellulomonas sp.]|uniref:helix-hairpin-helix domain-containing protein n=1 Tax=Cellulomonas sp. TaxID=40001 RepID=UPI002E314E4C|nr:helix-hairpin-helix domain-containing protein [Cellulomonas sp.]HEX5331183.1 helix-hairpin-helix domain-containing protein [Cellulomonas sp.]
MQVRARHAGGQLPFERDQRLVLRRLPVGAVVTRAVLTLTPVSTDPTGRFLETLTFRAGSGAGDRGATKVVTTAAVEIDLHARRRLAALTGSGLVGSPLLVDIGGGFLGVDTLGGFSGGAPMTLTNAADLPGLTVTGLRMPRAGADVSVLRVSSPPSGVTVAVEGGPVFFTHRGDLVEPVTTPDFSDVLQGMLPELDVENGCWVVPFVLHSDSIARLDVDLAIDLTLAASAAPDGVRTVQAAYRFDGAPVAGGGVLAVSVPPGMVAVEGATTGRVQGAFAATRVVHGALTAATATELVVVAAGQSLAQALVPAGTVVATSVDLLLTAVTAAVTLAVDLVVDLDGKPGSASLLPHPADVALTRDDAGSPTWVNVALPREVEVAAGRRVWLVVQARTGSAAWSVGVGPAPEPSAGVGPALQGTRDGGLSWRAASAGTVTTPPAPTGPGLAAALRLRHATTGFHLPLELRVGAGGTEVGVSVQRFAASGAVDFGLDFPDVAGAVNTALAAAGGGATAGGGEHVANGDFASWYRVGTTVRRSRDLTPDPSDGYDARACVFGADGARALTVGSRTTVGPDGAASRTSTRLVVFDVLSGQSDLDVAVDAPAGMSEPTALALDPTGRRLLVATLVWGTTPEVAAGGSVDGSWLQLLDVATGRSVGASVPVPEPTMAIVPAADGRGVYLAGGVSAESAGTTTVLRHVDWEALIAAAGGSPLDWDSQPHDEVPGLPLALAGGADGRVVLLTGTPAVVGTATGTGAAAERVWSYADRAALAAGDRLGVDAVADAVDVACPSVDVVLVLAEDRVRYLRATDLSTLTEVRLAAGDPARAWALDPQGALAVIAREGTVAVLDVTARRMLPDPDISVPPGEGALAVAVSPTGTHATVARFDDPSVELLTLGDALPAEWELTAGTVRPVSLPATGEVLALLGSSTLKQSVRLLHDAAPGKEVVTPRPVPATTQSSMSQVVPVVGGARYRFGFDGVAFVDGARAQVIWRGDACSTERTDRVPVPLLDLEKRTSLDRVPRQEVVLVAPAGATQAEVQFFTPEGRMLVDRVTLSGSTDVATSTWQPAAASTTVMRADDGVTLSNGGAVASDVSQLVGVVAGDRFDLVVTAAASGEPGAAVELTFGDETGLSVGTPVRLPLDVLDLDARAASGAVPVGAVEAQLRVALPPGAVVHLAELTLAVGAPTDVGLYFTSEAPGELSLTDVSVTFDRGVPAPVPVPPGGLCPVTPTSEDGDVCYCQECGQHGPATHGKTAVTDAGRAASVTPCPTCGTARVRLGGVPLRRAQTVSLPQFRAVDRVLATPVRGAPALATRLTVDAPVTDVAFVGQTRAAQLRAAGVRDIAALARADAELVAALPGVSTKLAAKIIASAAELVRTRGERVVVGL